MRTISLKAVGNKNCQDSSDESEREILSLLSKKFSKFLKKNRTKDDTHDKYSSKKPSDFTTNKYTCYGCGEKGNLKAENVQIKKTRRRGQVRSLKRRENKKGHTLLEMIMM